MKYTLLKKWHPSQVEEVGHVFEEDTDSCIWYGNRPEGRKTLVNPYVTEIIFPHEIALLCEAGYLEKQEETGKVFNYGGNFFCGNPEPHSHLVHGKTFECEKGQPQLEKEQECTCSAKQVNYQVLHMPSCSMITPEQKPDTQLELWTEEPPEGTRYWSLKYSDDLEEETVGWEWYTFSKISRLFHLYNLHTKNCHRTQKSAEEALKRLMSE